MRPVIPVLDEGTEALSDVVRQCLQHLARVQARSQATIENYDRTYRQFLAYLRARGDDDSPRSFTVEQVMGFCEDLGARGAVSNTILNKLHALSTLAEYARKLKDGRGRALLASNPTREFQRPKEVRPETKYLLPDELQRFIEHPCHPSIALARAVLLETGLRVSEVCGADADALVRVGDSVHLELPVKGQRQPGAERPRIPLSRELAQAVEAELAARERSESGPLLVNTRGERWMRSQLTQTMTRLGIKAGITRLSVSAHKLRHTANVVAKLSGLDPYTRAALLAHRSMRTLVRYEHIVPGELADAREQASRGLGAYLARAVRAEVTS